MEVKAILYILTGIAAFIVQNIFYVRDDRTENHTAKDKAIKLVWHIAGGVLHTWAAAVMYELYGRVAALFMLSLLWFWYDGLLNTYVLNREFFYVGNTGVMDRAQRWVAKLFKTDARFISALLKIIFLIYSMYKVCEILF